MTQKKKLIELILSGLNRELEAMTESAQAAHEAATHEESKAEDQHDTRGLEASYLAGAQQARIEALKKVISSYHFLEVQDLKPTDPISLGALVELELNGKRLFYFLVSQGGGTSVFFEGKTVQVITPQAPLGDALLGRKVGESIELENQKTTREYEIIQIF